MRILLTLFCILPLTIDTAFAAAQWTEGADFTTIQGSLDKICKSIQTTNRYEKSEIDTSGGFCMSCNAANSVIISECAYTNKDELDTLQFPTTNSGNQERTDKICMCRRIYPHATKWRKAITTNDSDQFNSLEECNKKCYEKCKNFMFDDKCSDYKQEEKFNDGYTVKCEPGDIYLNSVNSLYKYGPYSGSNTAVIKLNIGDTYKKKWIPPETTTTYNYYHSIEDETGTYHCVNSSISDYDPNGADEKITCDSE